MRVILIGNYSKDKQESMNRFTNMLYMGYTESGIAAEIWVPSAFFAKWSKSTNSGLGKWLAYVDKYILFPIKLRFLGREFKSPEVRFHICDHSNAMYLKSLPLDRTLITCHDVLAIRGALGYKDAYCPATRMGKVLQQWILRSLSTAKNLAAVSQFTLDQLNDLLKDKKRDDRNWKVIHNGFNGSFWRMDKQESTGLIVKAGIPLKQPYILHVGSQLPRKNRKLLLDMAHELGDKFTGQICYAGQAPDETLIAYAASLGLQHRLVSAFKPDHDTLVAIYNNCDAFIFPSFSEGFGWPVIEGQACGVPVITSSMEPFFEVGGKGALYADPSDAKTFASAFSKLADEELKKGLIEEGLVNCSRFDFHQTIKKYIELQSN